MSDIDADTFVRQAVLTGLVGRQEAKEARAEADDSSTEALVRVFQRHELLTRWQVDRLLKGETSGYFVGGCKILFHIAEGSFARVYRGVRVFGGQTVAIKILRHRFASDPEAVERFQKEAEAGKRLIHPNIVRTYEHGEDEGRYYMLMEFVEGSNLRDFLKLRGRLSEEEALPLMTGLSDALKYSLEHGVTHRDLKGTNILISSSGVAKLVDFGLATVEGDDKKSGPSQNQRTVDYSALERTCNSPKGDPRSDIFFLGCIFYQMLTGQLPLPEVETTDPLAKMLKRGINSIKPIGEQSNAPSRELCAIVGRMMKVDLRSRYQSMTDVLHDLEAYASRRGGDDVDGDALFKAAFDGGSGEAKTVLQEFRLGRPETPTLVHESSVRPTLLCVEVQDEIQQAMRKTLGGMGYRVMLVSDAERAAERYAESPADAVVFDVDGLGPNSIESFLSMRKEADDDGNEFRAVVLLGPRQQALAQRLPVDDRVTVLQKPIKMKQLQDAVTALIPTG